MPAKVKEKQQTESTAEKRYRLVVKTPEEGLKIIREKFGDKAEVVSVKQIDGQGLAKFLSSPKLEITLKVGAEDTSTQKSLQKASKEGVPIEEQTSPSTNSKKATGSDDNRLNVEIPSEDPASEGISLGFEKAENNSSSFTDRADSTVYSLMRRSGFDEGLLAALADSPELKGLEALPTSHALAEISHWLKSRYDSIRPRPTTSRVAFLGTPGSGKTTALCKILAHSAFFENRSVQVLKLDQDIPNPDDALRIFCESLGIHLHRDKAALTKLQPDEHLYVDTSGVPLKDRNAWRSLGRQLDLVEITTRVVVLNAAYDTQILKATLEAATVCRPTHLIFTHFDELHNSTKLWPFVFSQEVSTLMLTHGQNITSDYTRDNLCQFLLASSFPSQVLQPA
jgi:flagellar biosynthesis protein FlhF